VGGCLGKDKEGGLIIEGGGGKGGGGNHETFIKARLDVQLTVTVTSAQRIYHPQMQLCHNLPSQKLRQVQAG